MIKIKPNQKLNPTLIKIKFEKYHTAEEIIRISMLYSIKLKDSGPSDFSELI